jgi:hypothetical protein
MPKPSLTPGAVFPGIAVAVRSAAAGTWQGILVRFERLAQRGAACSRETMEGMRMFRRVAQA